MSFLERLFGPERKSRQLERDARAIVDADTRTYTEEHLRAIAESAAQTLTQIREATDNAPRARFDLVARVRERHREARRRGDQVGLSAMSLTIIYLEAEKQGELGAPARRIIDDFLHEHGDDPEAGPRPP